MKTLADVGLDTSVVVRLLVGEPENLAVVARETLLDGLRSGKVFYVSDLVVSEVYFALYYHYDVPKREARDALLDLFSSGSVFPTESALIVLTELKNRSGKLGMVDLMIHRNYADRGFGFMTFEKAAERLPDTVVLTA